MNKHERRAVSQYLLEHLDQTYSQVANIVGCNYSTITRIAAEFGVTRPVGKRTGYVIQVPKEVL